MRPKLDDLGDKTVNEVRVGVWEAMDRLREYSKDDTLVFSVMSTEILKWALSRTMSSMTVTQWLAAILAHFAENGPDLEKKAMKAKMN